MRANTQTLTTRPLANTHAPVATASTTQQSATFSQPAERSQPGFSGLTKEALKSLTAQIRALNDSTHPDFSAVLSVCESLKNYEDPLKQAVLDTSAAAELHQLRHQLPKLFRLIDQCLQIHQTTDLHAESVQTLCMGLGTLASPISGSLLTDAQAHASQTVLTSISNQLAPHLSTHFAHGIADTGLLLNCLNWFSRALKADLLQANQPAVNALFQSALEQLHLWSDGKHAANLNSRQLAKAMVQLNTMVKQNLINVDQASTSGRANRETWPACVQNLSRHFLSDDQWLRDCSGVELINVTNTLKDGLDQGLLDSRNSVLTDAFSRIAHRIQQQWFTDSGNSLLNMSNCANFLRCLFEHGLLGGPDDAGGKAVMHLVSEMGQLNGFSERPGNRVQSWVNLASFLKAADRWLATHAGTALPGSWAQLAQATETMISAIATNSATDPRWLQSPLSGSGLLSALQHLWQRGLVAHPQRQALQAILMQLLHCVPDWQTKEQQQQSLLLSVRALVTLTHGHPSLPELQHTTAFKGALKSLLDQLQQGRNTPVSDDERLACLQAIHTGAALGALSIDEFQPLLQRLLKTTQMVDLALLEHAIQRAGAPLEILEALSEQALSPAPDISTTTTAKTTRPRAETYRGEVPAPRPATTTTVSPHPSRLTNNDDWIAPRHVARPSQTTIATTVAAALPSLASLEATPSTTSTAPQLLKRTAAPAQPPKGRARQHENTAAASPVPATPSAKESVSPSGKARPTLQQAQKEWFALLNADNDKGLPQLKELAAHYPELLNQKATGKKGQAALFTALTLGRKDTVAWLINQPQLTFEPDFGAFLYAVLNQIGLIENRHVASLRLFIDQYIKKYDQKNSDDYLQRMPGAQPLSNKERQAQRAKLFSDEQKYALAQFAKMRPVFDQYKLLEPVKPVTPAGNSGRKTVTPAPSVTPQVSKPSPLPGAMTATELLALFELTGNIAAIEFVLAPPSDADAIARQTDTSGMTLLMAAIEKGHTGVAIAVLNAVKQKQAIAALQNNKGETALMLAAENNQTDVVVALLNAADNKQALIQQRDKLGRTALIRSAGNSYTKTSLAIIEAAPEINEFKELNEAQKKILLAYTAANGYPKVAAALLKSVSNPDALASLRDKQGRTALMWAADQGHTEAVSAILGEVQDRDALAGLQDEQGMTALSYACLRGNYIAANFMLHAVTNKDALVQRADNSGVTALLQAARDGRTEITEVLINAVSDKDALARLQDNNKMTALNWAAQKNFPAIAKLLINAVSDRDGLAAHQDFRTMNPIMIAAANNNTEVVTTILEACKDKEGLAQLRDQRGATALMWATFKGHIDAVRALLGAVEKRQALAQMTNHSGRSALTIAKAKGHEDIAKVLESILTDP